uniref:GRF-type domain-containing protein n=1 Tax=Brassica oleracea var. oleracea TaxID=109376 RepID=A0A0D3CNR0_BRAOL
MTIAIASSESEECGGETTDCTYSETDDLIRRDQAEISYNYGAPAQYPPQPEVEFGFPQTCYCGSQPVIATSYIRNDPGRRYYTCDNVDDGECHVWKWWDVAVMEEMRARDRHTLQLAEKVETLTLLTDYESEQKVVRLEKIVSELAKKNTRFTNGFEYFVAGMVLVLVLIEVEYFRPTEDAVGRSSLSPLQKCTAAIRQLAYGDGADTVDEYVRLGETTARKCLHHFTAGIIHLFGDQYLRRPTPEDLERLLLVGEQRGLPGMIGSIDCTMNDLNILDRSPVNVFTGNRKTNNCVGGGTMNDLNILDRSPVFDMAPQVNFYVNGREYNLTYYLTDGIYPKWATFIQSIRLPQGPKNYLFAKTQESVRKDVERAFGVLQARFAVVRNLMG